MHSPTICALIARSDREWMPISSRMKASLKSALELLAGRSGSWRGIGVNSGMFVPISSAQQGEKSLVMRYEAALAGVSTVAAL
jgi:hypothetical protein